MTNFKVIFYSYSFISSYLFDFPRPDPDKKIGDLHIYDDGSNRDMVFKPFKNYFKNYLFYINGNKL
jgi:hypothetical protein